jgi:CARDB
VLFWNVRIPRYRFLGLVAAVSAASLVLAVGVAEGSQPPPSAVAASGSTSPTGSTGATGPAQPLSASLAACHTDASPGNRYATFAAQMTAVPGTVTMSVEFILEQRSGGRFAAVSGASGFGVWVTSRHGVGIFNYSHQVTELPAPGAFRVNIHARWFGRRHRIIRADEIVSPVCVQPLAAPDLEIGPITHQHAGAGQVEWSVEVDNAGTVAAGAFQVTLAVGADALSPANVSGLAPGASVDVQFSGPPCASGAQLTAVADPSGAISEPVNSRRTKTLTCP